MHIVYITVEFVSERKPCGGLGHYLANIATIMAERGHQVTILVQTDHGGGYFWKPNVEVITYTIKDFELASVLEKITRKFILKDNLYYKILKLDGDLKQVTSGTFIFFIYWKYNY